MATKQDQEIREEILCLHEDQDVYDSQEFENFVIQTGYSPPQALILCAGYDPFDDDLLQFATEVFNKKNPPVDKVYTPRF